MTPALDPAHPLADRLAALGLHGTAAQADAAAQRRALAQGPTLHVLAGESLVEVRGPDAAAFLQGQFSNDIGLLGPDDAQWTSYSTPQGRVLSIPLAWKESDRIFLAMPADVAEPVIARLRRYVLRARVELNDVSGEQITLAVGGSRADTALAEVTGATPEVDLGRTRGRHGETVIRLRPQAFLLTVPGAQAPALWDALARVCTPASERAWHWHLIQGRIPRLGRTLQDQFVPQMLGLEHLGAISFDKGCYPGQEIVARAQYRGQVKRRLVALHADDGALLAGQDILRADRSGAGTVVDAAPAPGGGWDVLAVMQVDALDDRGLHVPGATAMLAPKQ